MVLLDSDMVAVDTACCCGDACCANDGSGCFPLNEADCLALPGRFIPGQSCDDVICASCGDCHCAFISPFLDSGSGLCYTHFDIDCSSVVTFSGVVDCGALFTSSVGTNTCCSPCSGSCTDNIIDFCNYIDPEFPFCDSFADNGCAGFTCEDPESCPSSSVGDVLGQVFDPCP